VLGLRRSVYTVPVNYAIQFSGPVTTFTARHVWYGVGMRSICQPDPLTGYKAVVPPPLFHQLSLHPFPLPLHFSGVSCLRPLASPTFPHPSLRARGPTGPYNEASQKNASMRLLAVIRSRSRQHFLLSA
jgi:hypothetical protein